MIAPQLYPIQVSERWAVLGLDLIGPFTETLNSNKYVLTITDLFTK